MTVDSVTLGILLLGLVDLVAAIRIRRGGLRKLVLLYRDFRWPWVIRNVAFSLAPGSAMLLSLAALSLARANGDEPWATAIVLLALPAFAVTFALTLLWMYAPPQIAKPSWLRVEEAVDGPPTDPDSRGRRLETLWLLAIFVPLILAAIVILGGRIIGILFSVSG